MSKKLDRRKRRTFTPEFEAEAVRLCGIGGRTMGQVASDLDLTQTALREWVKRAEVDAGKGAPEVLNTVERDELQGAAQAGEAPGDGARDPKKAAAFFAKESE